ncbi:hypothetical protein SF83666_c23120 [Sinorhizobium fredii CCBAU 83666]|nr:hypothetical protein SF83666_c23120 [Sinorhizobium fredii CCBAU 83666]
MTFEFQYLGDDRFAISTLPLYLLELILKAGQLIDNRFQTLDRFYDFLTEEKASARGC